MKIDVVFFKVRGTIPQIPVTFVAWRSLPKHRHSLRGVGWEEHTAEALPASSRGACPEALCFALAVGAGQSPSERLGVGTPGCVVSTPRCFNGGGQLFMKWLAGKQRGRKELSNSPPAMFFSN